MPIIRLEEESSHSSAHALAVVQNIEFIHKLVDIVATFGNRAQIRHQTHVVALLQIIRI